MKIFSGFAGNVLQILLHIFAFFNYFKFRNCNCALRFVLQRTYLGDQLSFHCAYDFITLQWQFFVPKCDTHLKFWEGSLCGTRSNRSDHVWFFSHFIVHAHSIKYIKIVSNDQYDCNVNITLDNISIVLFILLMVPAWSQSPDTSAWSLPGSQSHVHWWCGWPSPETDRTQWCASPSLLKEATRPGNLSAKARPSPVSNTH